MLQPFQMFQELAGGGHMHHQIFKKTWRSSTLPFFIPQHHEGYRNITHTYHKATPEMTRGSGTCGAWHFLVELRGLYYSDQNRILRRNTEKKHVSPNEFCTAFAQALVFAHNLVGPSLLPSFKKSIRQQEIHRIQHWPRSQTTVK